MNQSPLGQLADRFRFVALASLLALCVVLLAWHLWLLPVHSKPWFIALMHVLPLLAFLPGMLQRKPRVFIWLCFFILLYFSQGVVNAFALPSTAGILGLLETLLTSVLFLAAMMAARYFFRLERIS